MPTICFDQSFTPIEKRILSKTLHQNCRDLGVFNVDASIEVRRAWLPYDYANQRGCLGNIIHLHPTDSKRFIVQVNAVNDIRATVFCIGHEMVHFKQYVRGDMVANHKTGITYWKGRGFTREVADSPAHYANLPWEKEAMAKQDGLLESAIRCLTREERLYCVRDGEPLQRAA